MTDRLEKIMSGEVRLGFGNQHDDNMLKQALEALNNPACDVYIEKKYNDIFKEFFEKGKRDYSPMSLACALVPKSYFDNLEEPSTAWYD